ncbi:hypothetical protein [Janthinobacterium sp. RB2R34]|uniref:hypothetical protein n=1 Tax=Janthinobacterium sp. RB2R34 TaxID=3424193 RepID=UPI003F1EE433
MIRRTTLLSTIAFSLLLGACSKHPEAADAGEGKQAQAAADAQVAEAPAAEPAPERKLDYWKALGPLLAGSYNGNCLRMPDGRRMEALVTIGADGKVASGDMQLDFHAAKMAMMMRSRDEKGQYSTVGTLAIDDGKTGMLSLMSSPAGKESTISLSSGDIGLMCSNNSGVGSFNNQALFLTAAKLLNGKKQSIGCLDTKNLLVRRKVDVEVVDGVIRIGDDAFDMKTAVSEGFTLMEGGSSLMLNVVMPQEKTVNVAYDGAGKLVNVQARDKQESTHFCSIEN